MDQHARDPRQPDLESLQAKLASLRPPMPELNWPEIWKEQGRAEVRREHAALASAQHPAALQHRTAWAWPLITAASLLLAIATSWDRFASIATNPNTIAIAPTSPPVPVADESKNATSQDNPLELAAGSASSATRPESAETESTPNWILLGPLLSLTINESNLSWRERLASGSPGSWEAWDHRDLKWIPTRTTASSSLEFNDELLSPAMNRELRSESPVLFPFFTPRINNRASESNSTSGDIL